jgi:hypothetical protein
MPVLMTWMLAAVILLTPTFGIEIPMRIDVDCESDRALEQALAEAKKLRKVDIYLHGVCEGNYVIATDGVTLRGATGESGLAAPEGDSGNLPVLEVVDAQANLRGLVVRGGVLGVLVRGWNAEVLLYDVDVREQDEVGVIASRGARLRLLDSTIHDGYLGVLAQTDSTINLQNVIVDNQDTGIVVTDGSSAALNDTTIENSRSAGLSVGSRSDVNVLGGVFRENGEVHIHAGEWSSVTLLYEVMVGSETDATPYALGVIRYATIASYTTPVIYGNVSVLIGGSIRLGNTLLDGNLIVHQFANAHVRQSEITGIVHCADGSDVICRQTTTAGAVDCPSPTCGSEPAAAVDRAISIPEPPVLEVPGLERLPRSRSRRQDSSR